MPAPLLFKDDNGDVREVVESVTLTLDEIDARLAKAQEHVAHLQQTRDIFVALTNPTETTQVAEQAAPEAPAEPAAPAAPVDPTQAAAQPAVEAQGTSDVAQGAGVELSVIPAAQANADQGQAPAQPALDAPVQPTAAVNNGQVDPAAASNPTPAVPDQPIIGA